MKKLYAPWRAWYTVRAAETKKNQTDQNSCVFCQQYAEHNDEKNFILKRFKSCFVMLNLYPYNAGHVLIIPSVHVADPDQLTRDMRNEFMEALTQASSIVKRELKAQGINIGFNVGRAAGAGIPAHLHAHVLPRWEGDTNFLPLLADTKQISMDLHVLYHQLLKAFSHEKENNKS